MYLSCQSAFAHPHDVPAGRVDRQRRVERGTQLLVLCQVRFPLRAARRVDLVPEPSHLAEAPLLVVVVHVHRPRLDDVVSEQGFEVAVEVSDRAEAETRRVDGVHLPHAVLREMGGGTQAKLVRLVEQGGHDGRPVRAELQAVELVGVLPNPRAGGFGRAGVTRTLVIEDPRCDDLVLLTARLLAHGERLRRQRHAAHGGHPVREPQLVGVLDLRVFRGTAAVHVQIHEARQQVHARPIDDVLRVWRRAALPPRHARRSGGLNAGDPVVLDPDVHRAVGRAARAVDHRDIGDDHRGERPCALARAPGRRRNDAARGTTLTTTTLRLQLTALR